LSRTFLRDAMAGARVEMEDPVADVGAAVLGRPDKA
jgi:hypothetical protein